MSKVTRIDIRLNAHGSDLIVIIDLQGLRVLELGCGAGLCSFTAAALGANVTASDVSRFARSLACAGAQTQQVGGAFDESSIWC